MEQARLLSIGRLAEQLYAPVAGVAKAAAAIGVQPVVTIDGVPYFEEADGERIDAKLRGGEGFQNRKGPHERGS